MLQKKSFLTKIFELTKDEFFKEPWPSNKSSYGNLNFRNPKIQKKKMPETDFNRMVYWTLWNEIELSEGEFFNGEFSCFKILIPFCNNSQDFAINLTKYERQVSRQKGLARPRSSSYYQVSTLALPSTLFALRLAIAPRSIFSLPKPLTVL